MLEFFQKIIDDCRTETLKAQFEVEDMLKEILLESKDLSEEKIELRQALLEERISKRKNLYIYPRQVNV